jgi:predicted ribosome quality control (RQC) complex YloA/Tae2 family protein
MSDDTPPGPSAAPPPDPAAQRRTDLRRALKRYKTKLDRKLAGLQGDLDEARRAPEYRRFAEALLAYAHQVPARAAQVALPDPAAPERTLDIALDPNVTAPANAARYFKRASKAERGLREVPPRIAALERDIAALAAPLAGVLDADADKAADAELVLERVLAALPVTIREQIHAPVPLPRKKLGLAPEPAAPARPSPTTPAPRRQGQPPIPNKFVPWRFRSTEGWDVLIGRSSEANDYLTLHLARPEDYWFHAHGCPGSHVVLRRGKGANEPSKATLDEVASWAAFHSKARTAGKVPVIVTQRKYVRKPRGAKAGTVYVEREKMLMVRPVEPPRERMADAPEPEGGAE